MLVLFLIDNSAFVIGNDREVCMRTLMDMYTREAGHLNQPRSLTEGEAGKEVPDVPGEKPVQQAAVARHAQERQHRHSELPPFMYIRDTHTHA